MLFICHRIFEQHNNITMCDYIMSLNKFINIKHSMIFSLYIFISQAIVISSVASHHSKCQHHFSSLVFHIFMSYPTHNYGLLQPMSQCVYFFRFNSTRPMSQLQVVFRGRRMWWKYSLHHNMFMCLPCDRIWKVSARLFTQVWHEFWWLCDQL